jgi:hypothetical protein
MTPSEETYSKTDSRRRPGRVGSRLGGGVELQVDLDLQLPGELFERLGA